MVSLKGKIKDIQIDLKGNYIISIETSKKDIDFNYLQPDKDYKVEIKVWHDKRSLDSNAYAWTLLDQIAEKLGATKEDIYKEIIKRVGVFQIIPIKPQAISKFMERWNNKGLGWICEDIGACKGLQGYNNVIAYFGTSIYDSKEMSRFINEVVEEAKRLGIETLDEIELKKLSERWATL